MAGELTSLSSCFIYVKTLNFLLNPIESGSFSQNLPPNSEKQTKFEFLQILSAFQDLGANSVKSSQTQLDLERMQVAKARHLCRTIGPLFP